MKCLKLTNTSACMELFRVLQDGSLTDKGYRLVAVLPEFTRPYLIHTDDGPRWFESVLIPLNKIVVCPWTAAKLRFSHATRFLSGDGQGIYAVRFENGVTEVQYLWEEEDWFPGTRMNLALEDISSGKVEGASLVEAPAA